MARIIYLRTDTKAEMDAALEAAGIPAGGCSWCAVQHIGPVMGPFTGAPGAETCEVVDPRHHANLLLMVPLPDGVSLPEIQAPDNPVMSWT